MRLLTPGETEATFEEFLPTFEVDSDRRFTYVSPVMSRYLGYDVVANELVGQFVEVIVPDEYKEVHATVHWPNFMASPSMRTISSKRLHIRAKKRDGSLTPPLLILIFPRRYNDRTIIIGRFIELSADVLPIGPHTTGTPAVGS